MKWDDEQLLVVPFVMRTLRTAGLGQYNVRRCIQRTNRSLRCVCGMLGSGKRIE